MTKLFRNEQGELKEMLGHVEGISFRESPLDFFILLARYKFAARLLHKTEHVLDAGCGHGHGSAFLSKFAGSVTGADFDADLVANAAKSYSDIPNLNFRTIDLLNLKSDLGTYDAVVSMDVIEHFTADQVDTVASNYSKLTKEGGFAAIGTPNIASQPYASKRRRDTHLHEFEPDEFEKLLAKHFRKVFLFSMTDEVVSLSFPKMAWYLMALCVK